MYAHTRWLDRTGATALASGWPTSTYVAQPELAYTTLTRWKQPSNPNNRKERQKRVQAALVRLSNYATSENHGSSNRVNKFVGCAMLVLLQLTLVPASGSSEEL